MLKAPNSRYLADAWTSVILAMNTQNVHRGQIAERLGVHRNTVGQYLHSPKDLGRMPVSMFLQLLQVFNINPTTLLRYEGQD